MGMTNHQKQNQTTKVPLMVEVVACLMMIRTMMLVFSVMKKIQPKKLVENLEVVVVVVQLVAVWPLHLHKQHKRRQCNGVKVIPALLVDGEVTTMMMIKKKNNNNKLNQKLLLQIKVLVVVVVYLDQIVTKMICSGQQQRKRQN